MNSSVSISLDGNFFLGRVDGLNQLSVTKRRKTEQGGGVITTTFSSELTFYDDWYDYLKAKLIDDPNGYGEKVDVFIYDDDCGGVIFSGQINGDAIDWCYPECSIKASIVEVDPILSCIQSTMIDNDKNGFYSSVQTKKLPYCIIWRPIVLYDLVVGLGVTTYYIIWLIQYSLIPFIAWASLLILLVCRAAAVVTSITQSQCTQFNPGNVITNWITELDKIKDALKPCKKYHNVATVRDYIQNVCNICNINFKSSILNDSTNSVGSIFYNTVILSAPVKKGYYQSQGYTNLVSENTPLETLETFFNNYLNKIFNADWAIVGNDLIFERKDYFSNISMWLDTDSLLNDGRIQDGYICFKWSDKEKKAYGRFEYSIDAVEQFGNETKSAWSDIIEWNPTGNPTRKGEHTVTLGSSSAAIINDGIIENFAPISFGMTGSPNAYKNGTLVMSQDNTVNYKFLILNNDGTIKKYDNTFTGGATGLNNYNYPFWFKEGYQNNLYSLFHYIDDPRLPNTQKWNFDFTFAFTCQELADFAFTKYVRLFVGNSYRNGTVNEISIDYNKRTIKVSGTV